MSKLEHFINNYKIVGVILLNTLLLLVLIESIALTIETLRPGKERALSLFEWSPWRMVKAAQPLDNSFALNSDGFRAVELSAIPPKPFGETRVVILGGSTCVGYGIGDDSALNIDKA